MKTILALIIFNLVSSVGSAQCSLEKIIPLEMGITRAEALTGIKTRSDIHAIYDFSKDADSTFFNYTRIYSYMKDTATVSRLRFRYKNNLCLASDDNDVKLVFCNDKLYSVEISIYYSKDDYKECVSNYKRILEKFKEVFPYNMEFDLTYKNKANTVGEGLSFFKSKQESKKSKFERTDLIYRVKKVSKESTIPPKIKGAKEMFVLEINYVDLGFSEFNSSRF